MQPLPHTYSVAAAGSAEGRVSVAAVGLEQLAIAPPREFDGPGDQWSPESLLAAAVATCFILTFRSIARVSRLQWSQLECNVEATLERREGVMQFTRIVTRATLTVPNDISTMLCERALNKAEEGCLVANSLRADRQLQMEIVKVLVNEREAGSALA